LVSALRLVVGRREPALRGTCDTGNRTTVNGRFNIEKGSDMAKAIRVLDGPTLTVGNAGLGLLNSGRPGSVQQQVHDGDTVNVHLPGNLGVRLLGIDTAEKSFRLPGQFPFRSLNHPEWQEFLADPFHDKYPPFTSELPRGLRDALQDRARQGAAENHHKHADAAEVAFEELILNDMEVLGKTDETFRFFLVFAYEVMDGFGRLLCYINRDQPDRDQPEPRPRSYNERLLRLGQACAYFIWPNINPWRKERWILDAVPAPKTAKTVADADLALREARESVQHARANHLGIFDAMDPLAFEPFEVRFLARRTLPSRWVIDLSRNDDVLIPPHEYHKIPRAEDRLWIPAEFVPLFVEKGWKRGGKG
jgi:hypothetical protein